jgi:hypothetical protein
LWKARVYLWVIAILLLFLLTGHAQTPNPPDYSLLFDKTDVMIPARDGVKLHTQIYAPKHSTQPLPIPLERTPYGLKEDDKPSTRILSRYAEMIPATTSSSFRISAAAMVLKRPS